MAISPQVMSAFLSYDWPGNVRELEHAIEGSLAFARDNTIELKHIPPSVKGVTAATWMLKTRSLDSPALDLGLGPKTEYDKSVTGTENADVYKRQA